MLHIELDGLELLRELGGHEMADRIVESAALRIRSWLNEADTLARIGAGSFGVIVDELSDLNEFETILSHMAVSLAQLHVPRVCDLDVLGVAATIGFSIFPMDGDDHATLMESAESAAAQVEGSGDSPLV